MKLEKKLSIYILILVVVSVVGVQLVFFKNASKILEENRKDILNSYSYVMSNEETIIKFLENKGDVEAKQHLDLEWVKLIRVNYILITDRNGEVVGYKTKEENSNIKTERKKVISKMFTKIHSNYKNSSDYSTINKNYNLDEENGFYEEYVPIIKDNVFLGMLVVQEYYSKSTNLKKVIFIDVIVGTFITIILAIILSIFLAKNIKKGTFGIDPIDVGRIYAERQQIFDTISDEIITVDSTGKTIKRNKAAEERLKPQDEKILNRLTKEILETGKEFFDVKYILSSGKVFISGLLIHKELELEVLFIIKQEEKVNKLAREITGVTQIIDSMRANVHEFKNKIHVISGLLKLEEYEEAIKYVSNIKEEVNIENIEVENINDPIIKAILLTKINLAKEKKISFRVDEESNLMKIHGRIESDDLIIIIGNLIENAMESFRYKDGEKKINITLLEDTKKIVIQVSDNGSPIKNQEKIFNVGYSSKGIGRGSGLALIKNLVDLYDGKINVSNEKDFKIFTIELTKWRKND